MTEAEEKKMDAVDMSEIEDTEIDADKGDICREIMGELPEWFPAPEGIEACAGIVENLPMLACVEGDTVAGVLALKHHEPSTMEIFVVAARPKYHRRGVGRRLIAAAERYARARDCRLLTVKTLAPRGRPEPHLEATRAFYDRTGFIRAEVFPTLWHVDHPCLFFVKPIGKALS